MEIKAYEKKFREQLVAVWESSARATHRFVSAEDFEYFKQIVNGIDFFASFPVYCLVDENKVIGFIGVADQSIEALFLDPGYIGKGLGKMLMEFAMHQLKADRVEVNEQNTAAVEFYSKFGFVSYERVEKSREGKDYPLLKMKLERQE